MQNFFRAAGGEGKDFFLVSPEAELGTMMQFQESKFRFCTWNTFQSAVPQYRIGLLAGL